MDATHPPDDASIKVEVLRYQRNPHFTGRRWELMFLEMWLSTSGGRYCAVGGIPGIGKTQLINEYVHRFSDRYNCIIWLPSGETGTMMAAVRRFCQKLGIAAESEDPETYAKVFKNWLANSKNWLLIFDDVSNWAIIRDFLPKTHGTSLVTTQDLRIIPSDSHNLRLDSLDPASGAEMLSVYLGSQLAAMSEEDQALARAVSEEVGGLPMALAHVVGYMTKHELRLQTIAEQLRNPGLCDKIWREDYIISTLPHPLALAEIWDTTMAGLRPESRAMLELLSFFDADQTPQYFWNSRIEDEPQRAVLDKTLEDLQQRGLVHRKRIEGITYLSTHRALQRGMLCKLRWGSRLYHCALENAIAMVSSACPDREPFDVPDYDLWPKYDRVFTQAESLRLRVAGDRLPNVVAVQLCNIYAEVSCCLHVRGDHGRAQQLLDAGLGTCEAMPESAAASVHATLLLLAVVNKNVSGPPKRMTAIAACNRAIVLREEHPTKDAEMDDLLLSDARHHLGRAFLESNDWPNANTQLLESLNLMEKHSAPHDLPYGFASAYEALSLVAMNQQRPVEALDLIDKAIWAAGLVQTPSAAVFHQLTFNRAVILFNQDNFDETWKVARETLRSGEALLGAESPSVLNALFWVAHAAFRQNRFRDTERNLRDLLRKSAESIKWPKECVARAKYLLAETLQAMDEELEEAMELKKEAAEAISENENSLSMIDFDVRISIYHGRSI